MQTVQLSMTSNEVKKPAEEPRNLMCAPPKMSSVGQQTTPIVRQLMLPLASSGQPTVVALGQQTNVPPVPKVSVNTPLAAQRLMSISSVGPQNPILSGQRVHAQPNQMKADSFSLASVRNGNNDLMNTRTYQTFV